MKNKNKTVPCCPPPERPELKELPVAPRLIMEIGKLQRSRVRDGETEGVMQQSAARLLLAYLAVDDGVSQLSLTEKTRLSAPTVSILLRKMENEGYVSRTPSADDRRVTLVTLTDAGRSFDRDHLHRISRNDRQAMRGFSKEEEAQLVSFLCRIRDNLTEK